jgi:hypothetical protein
MAGEDGVATSTSSSTTRKKTTASVKGRKRRETSSSFFPSEIVCTSTHHGASTNTNTIELAVLLSVLVVALYFYGFVSSMQSLPDIPDGRRWGANLNVAKLENVAGSAATTTTTSMLEKDGRHMQQKGGEDSNKAGGSGGGSHEIPEKVAGAPAAAGEVDNHLAKGAKLLDPPPGRWPVTLRTELDDYETILHVGDGKTKMRVPKFWSPPLHNGQLFTREQAMQVGTCVEADPSTASHVRGDTCPPDQRTIFIAIASYRDYQCRYTVESAFLRAANPHRIRVGTSMGSANCSPGILDPTGLYGNSTTSTWF